MMKSTAIVIIFASWSWLLSACGGATSASEPDASSRGTEDASPSEAGWDGNASTPCSGGSVTFTMRTDGNASSYCVGRACFLDWLDVTSERGEAIRYGLGCRLSCVDCRSGGCDPICIRPRALKQEGEELVWDGRVWEDSSSCGGGRACTTPTCASPGRYVAKMCVTPLATSDAGSCREAMNAPQSCVEVAFEYPTAAPVIGVVAR